jgi:DNA helicase-2/ATP-dependent DNA helicase PcrA
MAGKKEVALQDTRFETDYFAKRGDQLTEEQLDIQASPAVSLLIEAAAGAAKTTTLCLRICQALAEGARPERLLVLTFTRTACAALRRTLRLLGGTRMPHGAVRIETFDSYAAAVLRVLERTPDSRGPRELNSPEEAKAHVWAAVNAVAEQAGERHPDELRLPTYGNDSFVGEFLERTQRLKGTLALSLNPPEGGDTPDHAWESLGIDYTLLRVLRQYEARRRDNGRGEAVFRMPFDATHDLACLLLPDSGYDPQEMPLGTFDAVFVDEMHDCNEAMFTVLRALLRRQSVRFCAVGDRHQVIHQHHGADARFMGPELDALLGRRITRLPLTLTFRYGATLAGWMSRLAGKRIESFPRLRTEVRVVPCGDAAAQEQACVKALKGWRLDNCAILLREDFQSVLLENALHAHQVPYQCEGFASYLRRPEVLFVRTVFAVASGRLDTMGGPDTRALVPDALFELTRAQVIDTATDPDHGSAEEFLREARRHASASEAVVQNIFMEHVRAKAPASVRRRLDLALRVVQDSRDGCSFDAFLEALDMRRFAFDVYVSARRRQAVLAHMAGLRAAARHYPTILDFFRSLQALDEANDLRLANRAAGKVYSNKAHIPSVTIARAAHVKGLEYEHVLLPYLEEGVFPARDAPLADESNLFYVAATRARQLLTVMPDAARPSRFVPSAMLAKPARG